MAQESLGVLELIILGDAAVAEADSETFASLSTNIAHKCQPRAYSSDITDDHKKNAASSFKQCK